MLECLSMKAEGFSETLDLAALRGLVLSLTQENGTLVTEVGTLAKENQYFKEQLAHLQEQLRWFQTQLFGKKKEHFVDIPQEQLCFEWANKEPLSTPHTTQIASHVRKVRSSTKEDALQIPDNLPEEVILQDLSEEEKTCPETGMPLQKIGEEITRKLAHRPGSFFIQKIVRPKYAHPSREEDGVKIACMPDALLPKCRADESLLAEIVTRKFADHLPLYRIAEIFSREKIRIHRRLLSHWVTETGLALEPLYHIMRKKILEGESLHIDETPVDLQKSSKQAYMWVLVGGKGQDPSYRLYHFRETREHKHVDELLGTYSGILHSDKYGAYEAYIKKQGNLWCPCFAHIRRKFFEAEMGDPSLRAWILEQIQQLFALETEGWTLSPEARQILRQEKAVPIIDGLTKAIQNRLTQGSYIPKSKFKEALGYYSSLALHLKNYTTHPFAHLDNNPAERAIRPLAIGRKNWLFLGSPKSGKAAAILLSLVQTCRALGVNPRVYLEDVFRRIMGHTHSKLHELLPDEWKRNTS